MASLAEAIVLSKPAATLPVAAQSGMCVFSVDVEDWFHILDVPSAPSLSDWDNLPSRVESNFYRLLDLFSLKGVHVTCFFLGWVAERFPQLVREAVRRKHEIGSHGYGHQLLYRMTRQEFKHDAFFSRILLEDISGTAVTGYRSPGFSATGATPWFFDELAAAGYEYDSSVFPSSHGHGGMPTAKRMPHLVGNPQHKLIEFPISVAELAGKRFCFFGGGYLRFYPYWLIRRKAQELLKSGLPVVFYIHPREIDPAHPRLPMSLQRRFKSYVNLQQTENKILRILNEFPVTSFRTFLALCGHRWSLQQAA